MNVFDSNLVPKLHPLDRGVEADDPMELIATPAQGDPEVMLECMIQEFLWMGWDAEQLLGLFHSPLYPVLNQLRKHYGDAAIQQRVEEIVQRWGVLRFRETIAEDPEPDEDDVSPMLIQVSTSRLQSPA
jgi:hypothetical protein